MSTNTRTNARLLRMREQSMQEAKKEIDHQQGLPSRPGLVFTPFKCEKNVIGNDKSRSQLGLSVQSLVNARNSAPSQKIISKLSNDEEWDFVDPNLPHNLQSDSKISSFNGVDNKSKPPNYTQIRLMHPQNSQQLMEMVSGETDSGADGESPSQHTPSPLTDTPVVELKSPVQIPTQRLLIQAASVDSPRSAKICPIKIISTNGTTSNLRVSTSYQPWTGPLSTSTSIASPSAISLAPLRVTPASSLSRVNVDATPDDSGVGTVITASQMGGGATPIFYICTTNSNPPTSQLTSPPFSHINQPIQLSQVPLKPSTSCPTQLSRNDLLTSLLQSQQANHNETRYESGAASMGSSVTSNAQSSVRQGGMADDASIAGASDINVHPTRDKQKRVSHNQVERRRREVINHQINILRDIIPSRFFPGNGSNKQKGNILTATATYINHLRQQEEANKVLRRESNHIEEAVKGLLGRAWLLCSTLQQQGIEVPHHKLILDCEDRLMEWLSLIQQDSGNLSSPVCVNNKHGGLVGSSSTDFKVNGVSETRISNQDAQYLQHVRLVNQGFKMEPLSVLSNHSDTVMEVDEKNPGASY